MTQPVVTTPTSSSHMPVRIALAPPSGRLAYRRLRARIGTCGGRVELVGRGTPDHAHLLLFDPCAGGRRTDLARLSEVVPEGRNVVVYTGAPAVDPLAFAMAGSLMDGRLRGWLSENLSPEALVSALERIHRGEVVVEGIPA